MLEMENCFCQDEIAPLEEDGVVLELEETADAFAELGCIMNLQKFDACEQQNFLLVV